MKKSQHSFVLFQSLDSISCVSSCSSFESNCKPLTAVRIFIAVYVWKTLSLAEKISVLKKLEETSAEEKDLVEIYGVSVATIRIILTNKSKIQSLVATTYNLHRKRKLSGKAPNVDEDLFGWFRHTTYVNNIPVSRDILRDMASFFAEKLSVEDFCPTTGWLGRWKKRFNVVLRKSNGVNLYYDQSSADECIVNTLSDILK